MTLEWVTGEFMLRWLERVPGVAIERFGSAWGACAARSRGAPGGFPGRVRARVAGGAVAASVGHRDPAAAAGSGGVLHGPADGPWPVEGSAVRGGAAQRADGRGRGRHPVPGYRRR